MKHSATEGRYSELRPACHLPTRSPLSALRYLLGPLYPEFEAAACHEGVETLAAALNARVVTCAMNVSGQLLFDQTSSLILLNETDAPRRRRFTLAHEVAHLLLIRTLEQGPNGTLAARLLARGGYPAPVEQFINRLAAEILFPRKAFITAYEELHCAGRRGFSVAWTLHRTLNASLLATLCRIASVGHDYLFLRCSWRPTMLQPEKLRIDWVVKNTGVSGFVAPDKGVPFDGPIGEAHRVQKYREGVMRVTGYGRVASLLRVQAMPARGRVLALIDLQPVTSKATVRSAPVLTLSRSSG